MKRLDKYLKNEEINRNSLINTLNQNIQVIQNSLQSPVNFKKFYWKPDMTEYGFASNIKIKNRMEVWEKQKKFVPQE
jgi:transposase